MRCGGCSGSPSGRLRCHLAAASRGRAVAPAVAGRAQVRAALQHPCAGSARGAVGGRGFARARRHSRMVWRRRAADTSRWSIPTRCRSCRGGRRRWAGEGRPERCRRRRPARGSASGTRPAGCWPSNAVGRELLAPGVYGAVEPPRAANSHSQDLIQDRSRASDGSSRPIQRESAARAAGAVATPTPGRTYR